MIITNLKIKNFRNQSYRNFDFNKGINVISGPNGVGKTSIVEAIYYLSLARSFRYGEDKDLIQKEHDFALIEANINEGEINRKIKINLTADKKEIFINNKKIRKLSELSAVSNVISFIPDDVMLFKSPPGKRRTYLDINLSKKNPLYFDYISRYEKALKERNDILKMEKLDPTLLDASTEVLAKLSGPILNYRQDYVKDINNILKYITHALTGAREDNFEVIYKPFIEYNSDYQNEALNAFNRSLERDIRTKQTNIGVHREDFSMTLNGRDIALYGSQGENRIAALAIMLAPYFLIEDEAKRPIVVLDDVMSELDNKHRELLIKFLDKLDQVFITGTKLNVKNGNTIELKENKKIKEVF